MRKVLLCAFLLFLSITLYTVGISYGLFETTYIETMKIDLAKWQIKINGTLSKTLVTDLTIDTFEADATNDSKPGTIAPGGSGHFDIELDPNGTETSFRYDIFFDFDNIENTAIEVTDITVNNGYTLTNTAYNTYSGIMNYSEISSGTASNPTITINIRWNNDDDNNEEDSKYMDGTVALKVPITIKLTQYLGETLDYEEILLYNKITALAELDTDIDYTSTSGSGLFKMSSTASYTYPTYYYRGSNQNNNVIFNGKCYKIVRTTDDGGIRIAYAGSPIDGVCNNIGGDNFISTDKYSNDDVTNTVTSVSFKYGDYDAIKTKTIPDTAYYGNNVTYSSTNGTYTITDTITVASSNVLGNEDIYNHGYTCLANTSKCSTVFYVVGVSTTSNEMYAVELTNGRKVDDILDDNLSSSGNGFNNNIHDILDEWYENNVLSVNNKIEDSIYCNDRFSINDGIWGLDDTTGEGLRFRSHTTSTIILACSYNDSFTVSNTSGNKKSNYPIGLLTADEYRLAGGNFSNESSNYLNSGYDYWTMSPGSISKKDGKMIVISSTGKLIEKSTDSELGIRPVITLKHNVISFTGTGTSDDPYVIR